MATGHQPILIAGATASGKSRHALDLARRLGGVVINADSMQVYAELRVLSARPSAADEQAVPHRLYGHVPARERYSVGRWLADAAAVLDEARIAGLVAIFVGGTGLYFKALTEGLTSVPPIPPDIRERWRARLAAEPPETLHRLLAEHDAESAAAIRPGDRTRIARAWEVLEATGRPLAAWRRRQTGSPLVDPLKAARIVIEPDRAWLHERIAERARQMVAAGGLDEARRLGALGLHADLPAMKAIGVRQFLDHFSGKLSLEEALSAVKTETRRYAKRQSTWFRHQAADWTRVAVGEPPAIAR